jgi:hypothetical protein
VASPDEEHRPAPVVARGAPRPARRGAEGGAPHGDARLRGSQPHGPGDRGSVTAETAVVLPALVLILAVCVWALTAGVTALRCVDGARAAARELARGEAVADARAAAWRVAPGADVSVTSEGDLVRVIVSDRATSGLPGLSNLLDIPLRAEAVAVREHG